MNRYATIDIGSNSIKICVSEIREGNEEILLDRIVVTRMGEGLYETGRISPDAMERNVAALADFVRQGRGLGVERFTVVGTMTLRTATNASEFVRRAADETGVEVEVISGEEEARLSHLAFLSGLGPIKSRVCVFDTGGGSTEFVFGSGDRMERRLSLNVGSRLPTERFLRSDPVTGAELENLSRYLEGEFSGLSADIDLLVGMGGTVTSLCSVSHGMEKYDPDVIQGTILPLREVERQIEIYRVKTIEERKKILGLMPKRADVILAGASVVRAVMTRFGMSEITVSNRGLRHGLMYDRHLRAHR